MLSSYSKINLFRCKPWITQGIKNSCATKEKLYQNLKYNKDPGLKLHYLKYCKVLKSIIEISKRKYFDYQILKSTNKTKTTWHLVKTATNKRNSNKKINDTTIDGELVKNSKIIANSFNLFFSLPVQNSVRVSAQDSIDKNFFRNSILNQTLGINKKTYLNSL